MQSAKNQVEMAKPSFSRGLADLWGLDHHEVETGCCVKQSYVLGCVDVDKSLELMLHVSACAPRVGVSLHIGQV